MSLTRPFINTISAFDGLKNNNLPYLSVLGGDKIDSYTYKIFNANTNAEIYSNTINVVDIDTTDIRNFSMPISANTCINNNSYYIKAYTKNKDTTSEIVLSTPFNCYVTPCVIINYKDNNDVFNILTNSTVFNSTNVELTATFDTLDLNSRAKLNSLKITVNGIMGNGIVENVYSGDLYYNAPYLQTIRGITNTQTENSKYIYYELIINGITVDGLEFNQIQTTENWNNVFVDKINKIGCSYVEYGAGGNFFATNNCNNGMVEINYNIPVVKNNPFGITLIRSIASDSNNVYCGGGSGNFAIYNKASGTFGGLVTTPFSTSNIRSIASDSDNVYCGGEGGKFAIYNKISGTFGGFIDNPFGNSWIWSIASDSDNVYCGGYGGKFAIYNKASGTFGSLVATPFSTNDILSIAYDSNNVYCGGGSGNFAIYNKASGAFGSLVTTPFSTSIIYSIASDSDNVYCGGVGGNFAIYNKASGTFGSLVATPFSITNIQSIASDSYNVYCGGYGGKFAIYNKASGTFGSLVTTPFSTSIIWSIASDSDNVYCGGEGGKFAIYSKTAQQFISPITMQIQRKLSTGENNWIDLQELLYANFKIYDTYTQSGVLYDYRLIAKNNSNVGITCSVLSQFSNNYICDSEEMYDLTRDFAYGSNEFVQETTLYSPIGSKYPYIGRNAKTQYNKGQCTAILFAPNTKNGHIDRMAQVKQLNKFKLWITNGKPKILKDFNGNLLVVFIENSISNSYIKELGNGISSVTFDYVEIGTLTQEYVDKLGLANKFKVEYISN